MQMMLLRISNIGIAKTVVACRAICTRDPEQPNEHEYPLTQIYALHKTELLYRNLAKSLKLAPFWCSYPLRQSPTGELEKMI